MAGNLRAATRGVAWRATAAGIGALALAVSIGVGAFSLTGSSEDHVTAALAATQFEPPPPALVRLLEQSRLRPRSVPPSMDVAAGATQAQAFRFQLFGGEADAFGITDDATVDSTPPDESPALPPAEATAAAAVQALAPAIPAERPPALPALGTGEFVEVTLSYYYCQRGQDPRFHGDGGGFCGAMRDGQIVYPGAAACAAAYLGQRFRIVGDPLERTYQCADTGSAVHGQHRDIWFMTSDEGSQWYQSMGRVATIEIVQ